MFTATATPLPPIAGPIAPSANTLIRGELLGVGQVYTGVHIELSPASSSAAARPNPNKLGTTSIATHTATSNPNCHLKGNVNPAMTADITDQPAPPTESELRPDQQPVGR